MTLTAPAWGQSLRDGYGMDVPAEVKDMMAGGLRFLATTQTPDGGWRGDPYGSMAGVTGLAVMSFLAAGEDPNYGPYAKTIHRAYDYILKQVNPDGLIGQDNAQCMYSHGFATLALAEAYGAVDDERIGPALAKATAIILRAQRQNPHKAWRYSLNDSSADTSVSGAMLMALIAARNAGMSVPDRAIEDALEFFQSCYSPVAGGWGYIGPGSANYPRAGIGALMYSLAGRADSPERAAGVRYILNQAERPFDSAYPFYARYYCSQAVFHAGEGPWREWNALNRRQLEMSRLPNGCWDGQFGKTCATSFALLSLAVNYRFLPIYERMAPGETLQLPR